jgi:hypothetical protein
VPAPQSRASRARSIRARRTFATACRTTNVEALRASRQASAHGHAPTPRDERRGAARAEPNHDCADGTACRFRRPARRAVLLISARRAPSRDNARFTAEVLALPRCCRLRLARPSVRAPLVVQRRVRARGDLPTPCSTTERPARPRIGSALCEAAARSRTSQRCGARPATPAPIAPRQCRRVVSLVAHSDSACLCGFGLPAIVSASRWWRVGRSDRGLDRSRSRRRSAANLRARLPCLCAV